MNEVFRFGSLSSGAAVVREIGMAAPDLILGRTLGFAEVALFSRGVGLYKMLAERVYALVRGVHFPTFAADVRRGEDGAALYARASAYLVGVMAPVLAVLAVLSEPLILFVFGEQWVRSVHVAVIVCSASILTVPYALVNLSLTAAGHVATCFRMDVATQAVKVALLMSSVWWPLERVVTLLALAYLWEALMAQRALKRAFGLGLRDLLRAIWRGLALVPFAVAVPSAAMWLSSMEGVLQGHRLALLLIGGAGAALGWAMGVLVLQHPLKSEVGRVVRWLRKRASGT
jgi:O-antigen/teichoic acid export membrane protein